MQVHALIDYDNLPRPVIQQGLPALARTLDSIISSVNPDPTDILLRLYGGWYDGSGLTNLGTLLVQEIYRSFPIPVAVGASKRRYIQCEIASSLLQHRGYIFPSTLRSRPGLGGYVSASVPSACMDRARCTIDAVVKWVQGSCPQSGCPVKATDVFRKREQKLVDTLLACDLISVATTATVKRAFILSEDDDLIPPLIMARRLGCEVWHIRTERKRSRYYDQALKSEGVRVVFL